MAAPEEAGFKETPRVAGRIFVVACMALAGLIAGQQMPEAFSLSVLARSGGGSFDAVERCALLGSPPSEAPPLRRGSSPALTKLLASRLQKGAVTPDLESWALSLHPPGSASDEVQRAMDALVADIRAKAQLAVIDTCVAIVSGKRLATFPTNGSAYEDWVLFNSFFRSSSTKYGAGFYVDVSAGDPVYGSPAFFFDACLGWKGLCVPPSGVPTEAYRANRTCKVVPLCVAQKDGKGAACSKLEEVLEREKLGGRRIDLVTMMWEGAPQALRCFPFGAFDAPLWDVQVSPNVPWRWKAIDMSMGAAGYWKAPSLMAQINEDAYNKSSKYPRALLGTRHSNMYLRWPKPGAATNASEGLTVPTMVIGPLYREGQPLYGSAFPACDPFATEGNTSCPAGIPTVDAGTERVANHLQLCPAFKGVKHRLSY